MRTDITRRRALGIVATTLPLAGLSTSVAAHGDDDGDSGDESGGGEYETQDGESESDAESASIAFEAQETSGSDVTVASITVPDGGYAVIHTLEHDTLGVSDYLDPGTHEDVTAELDDELTDDATLRAMAHRETNGNETYDRPDGEDADGHYESCGEVVAENAEISVTC